MTKSETVLINGVRINADSAAAIKAMADSRPAVEMCAEHRAYEADNCPRCGTSRMSF